MAFDSALPVKDSTLISTAIELGAQLRVARKSRRLSQRALAEAALIDLATVNGLERGRGTLGPLMAVLEVVEHRFLNQPRDVFLGTWIASARKAAGFSQKTLTAKAGVSKPTIIQIEHGRGNIQSFLRIIAVLGISAEVASKADPPDGAQLYLGDCLDLLPGIADHSVHAIIADLPYSLTALKWDRPIPLLPLWEQFWRLLTPTGVVVLTASQPFTSELVMSNPQWFKFALVWEKSRATGFLQARQRPLKKHEDILVFSPGTVVSGSRRQTARNMTYNPQGLLELERPVRSRDGQKSGAAGHRNRGYNNLSPIYRPCYVKLGEESGSGNGNYLGKALVGGGELKTHTNYPSSILRFASENKPVHPTQKPLELMRYLVRTFSNEGETVLDCCVGSGTTGAAAITEGRRFIGIEKDADYFEMAKERLMKTVTKTNMS